ncbi:MAG: hypothetical protein ACRETC_01540 [Gammaproteobacteria bacterium]
MFALNGCASSNPKLLNKQKAVLGPLSKTIVYIQSDDASNLHDRLPAATKAALWNAAVFSTTSGFYTAPDASSTYTPGGSNQGFWATLKPYAKEISSFHVTKMEQQNIHQAVKAIPMLEKASVTDHVGYMKALFFHEKTRQVGTQATIFIQPQGVYLTTDAKTVGVSYRIHVYVKNPKLESGAYELTSTTIQASRPIPYPEKTKHFNLLTAPTADILAWRMKILFANNGALFKGSLEEAMQEARWKLADYFSGNTGG